MKYIFIYMLNNKNNMTKKKKKQSFSTKLFIGLGRKVRGFDAKLWNQEAKNIVKRGCLLKFRQNKEMCEVLLSTGHKKLVEASPHDSIWGIGLDARAARQTAEKDWPGTNWLGEVLMEVRDQLRKELDDDADSRSDDDNK
jgi:ribA/ribD-fused uncharacterized protein